MKPVRHGELILKPSKLPKDAILKEETNSYIASHSESGHHHVLELDTSKIKVYTSKDGTYVELPEMTNLIHKKTGSHVHKKLEIKPYVYKIEKKRQMNYFTKMIEDVRD